MLVIAVAVLPGAARAVRSHSKTSQAMVNIHDQQFQMSRFLDAYYRGQPVAMNDIGAVASVRQARLWEGQPEAR